MELYSRLAQRINNWLSSQTAAGILYETDLRLRPNGDAGLLVTSVEAFRQYQLESAWTWEHQALTRARYSAGDPIDRPAFQAIRIEVLRQNRDPPSCLPKSSKCARRCTTRMAAEASCSI